MKNALKTLTLMTIGAVTISAQIGRGVFADVPFDFVAGYKSFPAGRYQVSPGPAPGVVSVRSLDGKTTSFVISMETQSMKTQTQSRLVFNRYAHRYFLSQIWVEGETSGSQLRQTPVEMEAARRVEGAREAVTALKVPGR